MTAVAAVASGPQWVPLVVGSLGLTAAAALYYLVSDHLGLRRRGRTAGVVAVVAGLLIGACDGDAEPGSEPLPTEAPWEGVPLREYENPELATQVLLHGIIADALINVGRPVESLPNVQNEVGLPTRPRAKRTLCRPMASTVGATSFGSRWNRIRIRMRRRARSCTRSEAPALTSPSTPKMT